MSKKIDFISGAVWGLVFFFAPAIKSGLFGFPFYDSITTSITVLFTLYMAILISIFAIYVFSIRRRKKNNIGFDVLVRSFAMFLIGFLISMALYFAFGLVGFSRGEFSL